MRWNSSNRIEILFLPALIRRGYRSGPDASSLKPRSLRINAIPEQRFHRITTAAAPPCRQNVVAYDRRADSASLFTISLSDVQAHNPSEIRPCNRHLLTYTFCTHTAREPTPERRRQCRFMANAARRGLIGFHNDSNRSDAFRDNRKAADAGLFHCRNLAVPDGAERHGRRSALWKQQFVLYVNDPPSIRGFDLRIVMGGSPSDSNRPANQRMLMVSRRFAAARDLRGKTVWRARASTGCSRARGSRLTVGLIKSKFPNSVLIDSIKAKLRFRSRSVHRSRYRSAGCENSVYRERSSANAGRDRNTDQHTAMTRSTPTSINDNYFKLVASFARSIRPIAAEMMLGIHLCSAAPDQPVAKLMRDNGKTRISTLKVFVGAWGCGQTARRERLHACSVIAS